MEKCYKSGNISGENMKTFRTLLVINRAKFSVGVVISWELSGVVTSLSVEIL